MCFYLTIGFNTNEAHNQAQNWKEKKKKTLEFKSTSSFTSLVLWSLSRELLQVCSGLSALSTSDLTEQLLEAN